MAAGVAILAWAYAGSRPRPTVPAAEPEPAQHPIADRSAPPAPRRQEALPAATGAPVPAQALPSKPPAQPVVQAAPPGGWRDDAAARHATIRVARTQDGEIELATAMPTLPKVRCDYRIPLSDDGKPLPTAADMVLLFPYPTEKAAITGIASVMSSQYGFTTISLRFPGMEPEAGIDREDRSRYYLWPESGSGKAWVDAVEQVRTLGGFPKRSVFVTGRSAGGAAAGLFAEAYPELVAAVANEAGRVYPDRPRFAGPTLIMHGGHDHVVPAVMKHMANSSQAGIAPSRFTFPPSWDGRGRNPIWQHSIHGPAQAAMWRWMTAVADLRLANGGTLPAASTWPVQEGGVAYPAAEVRDLVRQVTPIARQRSINGVTVAIAAPSADKQPRGLVVLAESTQVVSAANLVLDAEFLADNGWLVLAASADGQPVQPALRTALAGPELAAAANLPWMLVMDDPGELRQSLGLRPRPPAGIVLCRLRAPILPELAQATVPVAVIDQKERIELIRQRLGKDKGVTWRTISAADVDSWHRERCKAMREQANAWFVR